MGFATTGDVTFQSAAYVARYIMKKITGDLAEDHYAVFDKETGEIHTNVVLPEYTSMSLKPGIGADWLKKYKNDVYPSDGVIMSGGREFKPPRYYDNCYEHSDPLEMERIRDKRKLLASENEADNTPERLAVRETIQNARLDRLPRTMEE